MMHVLHFYPQNRLRIGLQVISISGFSKNQDMKFIYISNIFVLHAKCAKGRKNSSIFALHLIQREKNVIFQTLSKSFFNGEFFRLFCCSLYSDLFTVLKISTVPLCRFFCFTARTSV